jgi:hypothetical protein
VSEPLTGETIPDEQILDLQESALATYHDMTKSEAEQLAAWSTFSTCLRAMSGEVGYRDCAEARASCAAILNARNGAKP